MSVGRRRCSTATSLTREKAVDTPRAHGSDRSINVSAEPDVSETAACLCLASRKVARAITRAFEQALRPHGIRATQFSVLAILAGKGRQSLGALAASLGVERTTLTRNLAVLERQGLVRIRPGEDARARIVSITDAGRRTIAAALPAWRQAQSALTASIGGPMADSLRDLARSERA